MKFTKWIALGIIASSAIGCQKQPEEYSETKIIGGTLANNRTFYAAVVNKENPDGIFCGASFVAKRIAITAAHCMDSVGNKIQVRVGFQQDNTSEDRFLDVDSIVVHEGWNGSPRNNSDIAILKIADYDQDEFNITPIKMNQSYSVAGDTWSRPVTVIGSGQVTSVGTLMEPILREVDLKISPRRECKRILYSNPQHGIDPGNAIDDSVVCAGHQTGGKDSCQGDSGGPLITKSNNENVLVGVVSYGPGCAQRGTVGVYTRISAHYSWIQKTIKQLLGPVSQLNGNKIAKAQIHSCYDASFVQHESEGSEGNLSQITYSFIPKLDYREASSQITESVLAGLEGQESQCDIEMPGPAQDVAIDLIDMGANNMRFVAHTQDQVWTSRADKVISRVFMDCSSLTTPIKVAYSGGGGAALIGDNLYLLRGLDMPKSAFANRRAIHQCDLNNVKMNYYEVVQGGQTFKLASFEGTAFGRGANSMYMLASGGSSEVLFSATYTKNRFNSQGELAIRYNVSQGQVAHTWELSCDFNFQLSDRFNRSYIADRQLLRDREGNPLTRYAVRFNSGESHGKFVVGEEKVFTMKTLSSIDQSSQCYINDTPVDFRVL